MEDRVVKRTIILSVFASLLGLVASAQGSERLIGTDWVTAKMGYISFPSDFDPIDTGWAFSGMGNWHVMDQLDIQAGLEYAWADDGGVELTITTINADALYFFQPNSKIKPYLKGGLAMVWTDVEAGGASADDSNLGYGAGGPPHRFLKDLSTSGCRRASSRTPIARSSISRHKLQLPRRTMDIPAIDQHFV